MQSNTVEFFIECVRVCPCLWNVNHVAYRDTGKRDLLWEQVAKKCGMSNGRIAKSQWKKLRDSHREALRRRKPSSGPSAQFLKPWKYEENMKFILSKTDKTDSIMLCKEFDDVHETCDNSTDNMSWRISVSESELPIQYADPLCKDQESQEQEYAKLLPNTGSDHIIRLQEQKQTKTQPYTGSNSNLRQPHTSSNHYTSMRMQTFDVNYGDGLSKLFESLCQKTRELPRHLQLRVQREIFDSVSRAEEEALSLYPEPVTGFRIVSPSSSQGFVHYSNVDGESSREVDEIEFETKFDCSSVDNN